MKIVERHGSKGLEFADLYSKPWLVSLHSGSNLLGLYDNQHKHHSLCVLLLDRELAGHLGAMLTAFAQTGNLYAPGEI